MIAFRKTFLSFSHIFQPLSQTFAAGLTEKVSTKTSSIASTFLVRHYCHITISPQGVAAIDWYFALVKTSLCRLPFKASGHL